MNIKDVESLIEKHSIVELFNKIDNISNTNEENDMIVNKIRENIQMFLCSCKRECDSEEEENMFQRYKKNLDELQEIIDKQRILIDNIKSIHFGSEKYMDIYIDIYKKIKKELMDYVVKVARIDLLTLWSILDEDEKNVCNHISLYEYMELFYDSYQRENFSKMKNNESTKDAEEWKTYFYLMTCQEKQRIQNENLLQYFKKRNAIEDEKSFSIMKGDFMMADFQGQFSKNIYMRRKKAKLTQLQLAELSGISRTMIAKIEKVNQPVTLETAIRLLSALNIGIMMYPLSEDEKKEEVY